MCERERTALRTCVTADVLKCMCVNVHAALCDEHARWWVCGVFIYTSACQFVYLYVCVITVVCTQQSEVVHVCPCM